MRTINSEGVNEDDQLHFKGFKQTSYAGHKKTPSAICWSPSGDKLVVAQTSVKIWSFDLVSGCEKITESKLHQNNVDVIKFGTNNLFGTLSKESLRFWDGRQSPLKSGRLDKRNKSDLVTFCWNSTGSNLKYSSQQNLKYCLLTKDNIFNLMDFRNQSKPLSTVNIKNINSMEVCQMGWDETNSLFICVGGENSTGTVLILNGQTFEQIPQGLIDSNCARINDFTFSPDNKMIALVSDDSLTQIHEFPEFICQRSYSNKNDSATKKASFSFDGTYLAVGSEGNYIDIYNAKYGGQAHKIETQTSSLVLQWHPKRQILCYIDQRRKTQTFINIFQPGTLNI